MVPVFANNVSQLTFLYNCNGTFFAGMNTSFILFHQQWMHHCCSILFMIFFSSLRHLNIFCHFTNGVTQSLGSSIVIALFRWFTNSKSQIKNSKALGITERSGCFKFRTHTDDTQLRAWVCVCIFRSHTLRTDAY